MALILCPECELQISDKAQFCPHCGYPISPTSAPQMKRRQRSNSKHRRLPNGFGQITKLNNPHLRNPYRVMVTVGKDEFRKPICRPLKPNAYFSTYNEAYAALLEYNKNPYDLAPDITVRELYEKWTDSYFETLKAESSQRTVTSAWAYCSEIYNMRAKDVRKRHIEGCMENGLVVIDRGKHKGKTKRPTAGVKARIKSMFNLMLDYAVENEIVDRNYARTFEISNEIIKEKEGAKRDHFPFREDELQILWDNQNLPYVDILLIQCYSGWRPQELGLIELKNVDIEHWTFTGGIKTEAGINRLVPIHSKIRSFVQQRYNEAISLGSSYLFNCTDATKGGFKLTYDKYSYRFEKIMEALKLDPGHRPHDPRNTFITRAKKAGVDEYVIKRLVGHSILDVTEKVYTQRDLEWLRNEIEKIE